MQYIPPVNVNAASVDVVENRSHADVAVEVIGQV